MEKKESVFIRYPENKFPRNLCPEIVKKHELYRQKLNESVIAYSNVGHRNTSLYDWVLKLFENIHFSTVKREYIDSLCIVKTKLVIFTVLIDDVIDNKKQRNLSLLNEILKIPFDYNCIKRDKFTKKDLEYLTVTENIWKEIISEIKKYPNFEKYYELFVFDIYQLLNSMRYSRLVNTFSETSNKIENASYLHHGMLVMLQGDLDLMCSAKFKDKELGRLRSLLYISQKMARLGNLLTTYPREILEADVSSEIILEFLDKVDMDITYLFTRLLKKKTKYPKFELLIKQQWEQLRKDAENASKDIKSIDTTRFMHEREFIQTAYLLKENYW